MNLFFLLLVVLFLFLLLRLFFFGWLLFLLLLFLWLLLLLWSELEVRSELFLAKPCFSEERFVDIMLHNFDKPFCQMGRPDLAASSRIKQKRYLSCTATTISATERSFDPRNSFFSRWQSSTFNTSWRLFLASSYLSWGEGKYPKTV